VADAHPAIYTIPAHRAFADALAKGLLALHGGRKDDGLTLARGIVLLPNNRAVRAVRDAFVRRAEGGLLLPRLVALGDPELSETLGSALEPIGTGDDLPPAIAPMERQMILARLIQQERARAAHPVETGEAFRLAAALGRTLDQLIIERKSARDLAVLRDNPDHRDLSGHWEKALALFALLLERWPAELAARGRIDMTERRNIMLGRIARRWTETPPDRFVVAAGIATTAPAIVDLMRVVSHMPQGSVVLADLDKDLRSEEWQAIGGVGPAERADGSRAPSSPTHPQYVLRRMLDRMGVHPDEVATWRWGGEHDSRKPRGRAISNAMLPPMLTGRWQGLKADQRSLAGVTAIEAMTPAEEAQAIAIRLREALETPERTAALVTPDRGLATRVAAHLKRWGIDADDSAGQPLSHLPPGTLLMGLAGVIVDRFAPVSLLALLKHPLVRAGEGRLEWLEQVRRLDLVLRGPRPAPGLSAITALVEAPEGPLRAERAAIRDWWGPLAEELAPLEAVGTGTATLSANLEALRTVASALTGERVWAGHQGHAAAEAIGALADAAPLGPVLVDAASMASILGQTLGGMAVRPPQGGHPRIAILGLIEARLTQADLMILAGLNEGTWPALPEPDPWLAPSVRTALDLPSLEQRIGVAAQDFANGLGAPRVLLTRARRDLSAPTVASRFWLRLRAMAGDAWREDRALIGLARLIDRPPPVPRVRPPAPMPPKNSRPRDIAVTDLDRLRADPYAFYAAKILRLPRLEPVDAEPGPAWRGTRAHAVLERWMREGAPGPERLRALATEMVGNAAAHPLLKALWQPRLLAGLEWVASEVAREAQEGRTILFGEEWGHIMRGGVKLRGKPDRVDAHADGSLAIVDYKSGHAPSVKQTEAGFALQLGLLGLIAREGGFPQVQEGRTVSTYEYWAMSRKEKGGIGVRRTIAQPGGGRGKIAAEAILPMIADFFDEAAARWLTGEEPFTARPHADAPVYTDYDQLMRLDEWYARDDGGAEGADG